MSGVSIRPRLDADLSRCVEVLAEVHETDRYPIVWPVDPARWLTPPDLRTAWVAEHAGTVVGHVALVGAGKSALVSRLYVSPPVRRHAVGAQLLSHARAQARAKGLSLTLEVAELGDGAAIALYERSGWRHVSSTPAAWNTPDGYPVTLRYYAPPP